jgi:hypothetical protein
LAEPLYAPVIKSYLIIDANDFLSFYIEDKSRWFFKRRMARPYRNLKS